MKIPTTYSEALDLVHGMAQSALSWDRPALRWADEDNLTARGTRDVAALDALLDLYNEREADLDARFPMPKDIEQALQADVDPDDAMDPNDPLSALKITLDMARSQVITDPGMHYERLAQERAIDVVEDFVVRHGRELSPAPAPSM